MARAKLPDDAHESPRRVALAIAYDGTAFDSFARQKDDQYHTVEGALIDMLVERGLIADPASANWAIGSRTDKGVSARRNVVAFDTRVPADRVAAAIGTRIEGLWPLAGAAVPADFNPRHARTRTYRYTVDPQWLGASPDARMRFDHTMHLFRGKHDFSCFAKMEAGRDPRRTVDGVEIRQTPHGMLLVEVVGRSFLWNQVRRMIGAARAVAQSIRTLAEVKAALDAPADHMDADFTMVPARPLVLWDVDYGPLAWASQRRHQARLAEALRREEVQAHARRDLFGALLLEHPR